MKKIILKLFIPIPFIRISQPGTIDTSFNPGDLGFNNGAGANNVVWTTALQPDGKINIGG